MSILVFEVLKLENVAEVLRFSLHLIGWIFLLLFVCNFGQVLIDKVNDRKPPGGTQIHFRISTRTVLTHTSHLRAHL